MKSFKSFHSKNELMSNRCIFKLGGGFLCLSVIFVVLMFFLQDDSPLYEWVLFEDTRKKADDYDAGGTATAYGIAAMAGAAVVDFGSASKF